MLRLEQYYNATKGKNMIRKILKPTILRFVITSVLLVGLSSASTADQPRMQVALDALNVAQKQLEKGSHDKGGHRVKALALIKKAKKQVKKAMKYDRRH